MVPHTYVVCKIITYLKTLQHIASATSSYSPEKRNMEIITCLTLTLLSGVQEFYTLGPNQYGCHFPTEIFISISLSKTEYF